MLSGYAGSGKTAAAQYFQTHLPKSTTFTTAFADKVKDEVADIYGFPRIMCDTQEGKASILNTSDGPKTVRSLLIDYSLHMKQTHGESIWAHYVVKRIQEERLRRPELTDIIIHDWRFHIEIETLQTAFPDAKFHTIRIHRSSIQSLPIPSEHNIDTYPFSYSIKNEGTLEILKQSIYKIINETRE
jgi:hypothetical protein